MLYIDGILFAWDCTNLYVFQNEQNMLFDSLSTSEMSVLSITMCMCLTFIALQNIQQDGKKSEDWMWADSSMVRCGQDRTWTHGKLDSKKRRSVIPRHYWGFRRNFSTSASYFPRTCQSSLTADERFKPASVSFRTAVEIQWRISIIGRNYSTIPGHASLHLIRAIQGPGKDGRWLCHLLVRKYI